MPPYDVSNGSAMGGALGASTVAGVPIAVKIVFAIITVIVLSLVGYIIYDKVSSSAAEKAAAEKAAIDAANKAILDAAIADQRIRDLADASKIVATGSDNIASLNQKINIIDNNISMLQTELEKQKAITPPVDKNIIIALQTDIQQNEDKKAELTAALTAAQAKYDNDLLLQQALLAEQARAEEQKRIEEANQKAAADAAAAAAAQAAALASQNAANQTVTSTVTDASGNVQQVITTTDKYCDLCGVRVPATDSCPTLTKPCYGINMSDVAYVCPNGDCPSKTFTCPDGVTKYYNAESANACPLPSYSCSDKTLSGVGDTVKVYSPDQCPPLYMCSDGATTFYVPNSIYVDPATGISTPSNSGCPQKTKFCYADGSFSTTGAVANNKYDYYLEYPTVACKAPTVACEGSDNIKRFTAGGICPPKDKYCYADGTFSTTGAIPNNKYDYYMQYQTEACPVPTVACDGSDNIKRFTTGGICPPKDKYCYADGTFSTTGAIPNNKYDYYMQYQTEACPVPTVSCPDSSKVKRFTTGGACPPKDKFCYADGTVSYGSSKDSQYDSYATYQVEDCLAPTLACPPDGDKTAPLVMRYAASGKCPPPKLCNTLTNPTDSASVVAYDLVNCPAPTLQCGSNPANVAYAKCAPFSVTCPGSTAPTEYSINDCPDITKVVKPSVDYKDLGGLDIMLDATGGWTSPTANVPYTGLRNNFPGGFYDLEGSGRNDYLCRAAGFGINDDGMPVCWDMRKGAGAPIIPMPSTMFDAAGNNLLATRPSGITNAGDNTATDYRVFADADASGVLSYCTARAPVVNGKPAVLSAADDPEIVCSKFDPSTASWSSTLVSKGKATSGKLAGKIPRRNDASFDIAPSLTTCNDGTRVLGGRINCPVKYPSAFPSAGNIDIKEAYLFDWDANNRLGAILDNIESGFYDIDGDGANLWCRPQLSASGSFGPTCVKFRDGTDGYMDAYSQSYGTGSGVITVNSSKLIPPLNTYRTDRAFQNYVDLNGKVLNGSTPYKGLAYCYPLDSSEDPMIECAYNRTANVVAGANGSDFTQKIKIGKASAAGIKKTAALAGASTKLSSDPNRCPPSDQWVTPTSSYFSYPPCRTYPTSYLYPSLPPDYNPTTGKSVLHSKVRADLRGKVILYYPTNNTLGAGSNPDTWNKPCGYYDLSGDRSYKWYCFPIGLSTNSTDRTFMCIDMTKIIDGNDFARAIKDYMWASINNTAGLSNINYPYVYWFKDVAVSHTKGFFRIFPYWQWPFGANTNPSFSICVQAPRVDQTNADVLTSAQDPILSTFYLSNGTSIAKQYPSDNLSSVLGSTIQYAYKQYYTTTTGSTLMTIMQSQTV